MMIRVFPLLLSSLVASAGAAEKPNLLLFLADDMTYTDLGCYGNPDVKTPAIDQLAREGLKFTRCYNSAPTCSPLRQSLYTGLYPVRNGAHPNHSRVYAGVKSIPHYLEPLGYRVAIVGKRHEAPAAAFPFEYLGGSHGDPVSKRLQIVWNRLHTRIHPTVIRMSSFEPDTIPCRDFDATANKSAPNYGRT